MLLQGSDPHGRLLAHAHRVRSERARPHDRVLRLEVQVAHGSEGPVDADGARFGAGDHAARRRCLEIIQPAEGGRRRQLAEPLHLLGGPAFEIRPHQERAPRLLPQLTGEVGGRLAGPPENDEPAHAGGQRGVDLTALVLEASITWSPAERRKHEPRERRRHAGVMQPSTRGPRAPVAAGRLPAFPRMVRNPRNANTSDSFASPSKNSCSNGTRGRGATRAASSSTSKGLRAPPPEITSSSCGPARIQRSMPRAMVSTVSAVAVATASLSDPPPRFTSSTSRAA